MGTFIIRPTVLDSNDHWFASSGTVLAGFQEQNASPKCQCGPGDDTGLARLSFLGDSFYLDGSLSPISFAGLPSGFTPITATIKAQMANGGTPSGTIFVQADASHESLVNQFYTYEDQGDIPSIFTIYANGMGFRHVSSGSGFTTCNNARIEGTYEIIATTQWYIDPETGLYQFSATDPCA